MFYFVIIIAYRLMGKREIGQLGIIDLIISILIGELVAMSIENYSNNILNSIIPIVILTLFEIIFGYLSLKYKKVRELFDGKPSVIIKNGKINYKEMIKSRYSIDDLLVDLRCKEIKTIDDIEYAFLEHNGKLSIFKYNKFHFNSSFPMPIIIDGDIQEDTLVHLKKSKLWLNKALNINNYDIKNILYAYYKNNKIYVINK